MCSVLGQSVPSFGLAECCFVVWPLHFTSVKKQAGELFKQRTVTMLQSCSQLSPALRRATHVPPSYCYQDSLPSACLQSSVTGLTCESKSLSFSFPAVQAHQLLIWRGRSKYPPSSFLWVKSQKLLILVRLLTLYQLSLPLDMQQGC